MSHFAIDLSERTEIDQGDPLVGSTLQDRFRLDARIAAGGFGAIYRATHLPSRRQCAIKILHPDLAADLHLLARFRREGATLAQLRDPHTVTTYEYGQANDGTLFIVMELLHGQSLLDRLRVEGPLPWREVVMIARQVCESLAEAHSLGIVHRDLKPANIHLERDDFVKVLDFGVAKIRRGSDIDDGNDLTGAGQMIGTSDYMSPEQMMGAPCDGRCDIYTLGVVVYEAITGWRPFAEATNPTAQLALVLSQSPRPMSLTCPVPRELDRVIMTCLQRDMPSRYTTVQELAAAFDRLLDAVEDDREAPTVVATKPRPRPPTPAPPPITPPTSLIPQVTGTIDERPSWKAVPSYELSSATSRDVAVRRAVWALVLLIVATLGIVAANVL